jgi:uncharacterized RDD family membrane protein YckC
VEASAAQNLPVTKTCSQCGAVLAASVRACNFCDSVFPAENSSFEERATTRAQGDPGVKPGRERGGSTSETDQDLAWRGELEHHLEKYRARRGKTTAPDAAQTQLPFDVSAEEPRSKQTVAVAESPQTAEDDFSFTIAIGRYTAPNEKRDARMVIDVSVPPAVEAEEETGEEEEASERYGLYPVASPGQRRVAGLIDAVCLLFAYGGFLMLFGSLGGQFTLSKLSAAVYVATFAIVYFQYFALFTVFGGTTPGMMFRGLQVASFTGGQPTPRQMLLRAAGYMLSAGTFFMGFLWALWDDDTLTWHDRLSHTYLSSPQSRAITQAQQMAHGR